MLFNDRLALFIVSHGNWTSVTLLKSQIM